MKIAIYGGTFDPPHNGHVNVCRTFLKKFDVDRLFVIPTFDPPHKKRLSGVSGEHRLEMCKLAFSSISSKIAISDFEISRGEKSYTEITLKHFLNSGVSEILLICGTDMFLSFDEWRNFEYILKNVTLVCVRREKEKSVKKLLEQKRKEYEEKYAANIEFMNLKVLETSSTQIRNDISSNNTSNDIPVQVCDYIVKNNLYKGDSMI